MCAVEFLGEFVVTPGQLLDLADQRPAQIFEFLAVAGLAQLSQNHFQQHAELLVLRNGRQHLLGEG